LPPFNIRSRTHATPTEAQTESGSNMQPERVRAEKAEIPPSQSTPDSIFRGPNETETGQNFTQ
jgi:hypothetical protein